MTQLPKNPREWQALQRRDSKMWERAVAEDDRRKAGAEPDESWADGPAEREYKREIEKRAAAVPFVTKELPAPESYVPMSEADRKELDSYITQCKEAEARDDGDAIVDVVNDKRFKRLLRAYQKDKAREFTGSKAEQLALRLCGFESGITSMLFRAGAAYRRQLEKRVAALEPRAALIAVTDSIQELNATMSADVVPIHDPQGKLIGTRRLRSNTTIADLREKLDKAAATIESLERRASRHAEHLGRLETRLKALEHQ